MLVAARRGRVGLTLTEQELWEFIQGGERPGFEFKDSRSRDDGTFVEVVKAVLGMTNRKDGGLIAVGVADTRSVTGLNAAQVDSWSDADAVRQQLAPFADPFVYIDVELVTGSTVAPLNGFSVAVIRVHQFEQVPVLCAKDGNDRFGRQVLKRGALYVRSKHMPATTEVADSKSLRELLDLATAIGVRAFVTTARDAGLDVQVGGGATDEARYLAQLKALDE